MQKNIVNPLLSLRECLDRLVLTFTDEQSTFFAWYTYIMTFLLRKWIFVDSLHYKTVIFLNNDGLLYLPQEIIWVYIQQNSPNKFAPIKWYFFIYNLEFIKNG